MGIRDLSAMAIIIILLILALAIFGIVKYYPTAENQVKKVFAESQGKIYVPEPPRDINVTHIIYINSTIDDCKNLCVDSFDCWDTAYNYIEENKQCECMFMYCKK